MYVLVLLNSKGVFLFSLSLKKVGLFDKLNSPLYSIRFTEIFVLPFVGLFSFQNVCDPIPVLVSKIIQ